MVLLGTLASGAKVPSTLKRARSWTPFGENITPTAAFSALMNGYSTVARLHMFD
jgi:hypothetical protein